MIMNKKVISASRRVEMAGFYSDKLLNFLKTRLPPEDIHTIFIWTKHPKPMLKHTALREKIQQYDQCVVHFTITGMGGTYLEPGILSTEKNLNLLSDLIDFVNDPERICIRFDPIVHLQLADGSFYTNLELFSKIAGVCKEYKIVQMKVSWMSGYPKVVNRLKKKSITALSLSKSQWKQEADWVLKSAKKLGISVTGCCVPDWPVSACIDGERLSELHPGKTPASLEKATGQRVHCGCTKSWDIGWYYPCPGGCLYCYGNPSIRSGLNGSHPKEEKNAVIGL